MKNFSDSGFEYRKYSKSPGKDLSSFSQFSGLGSSSGEEEKYVSRTPASAGVSQKIHKREDRSVITSERGDNDLEYYPFYEPYTSSTKYESDQRNKDKSRSSYSSKKIHEHRDLREHLFSSEAGAVRFLESVSIEHIRVLNSYLSEKAIKYTGFYFEKFSNYFKEAFVSPLNELRDKKQFLKFTTHFFPNSNKEFLAQGQEISLSISVNAIYNPYYILKKIFSLLNFKSSTAHLQIVTSKVLFPKGDPRNQYFLPYIKWEHPDYQINIFVNHLAPCFASKLVEKYCALDERVRPFLRFILYWAQTRKILGSSQGFLSEYSWILMAIFFLQIQDGLLPSIQKYCNEYLKSNLGEIPSFTQMLKKHFEERDQKKYKEAEVKYTSFNKTFLNLNVKELGHCSSSQSLGELLTQFFYYFGFKYGYLKMRKMSISLGKYVEVSPNEEKLAFIVQDPIEPAFIPSNMVLLNSKEHDAILHELQLAYKSISKFKPNLLFESEPLLQSKSYESL